MIGGLLGKKLGMTQMYADSGKMMPITVIQAGPCQVMQVKTMERDGYTAVQIGFEDRKRKNATKPESGHAKAAKTEPKRFIREFRCEADVEVELGQDISVEVLNDVKSVDVIGTTKGKGFQGVMKRHGFRGLPASHGASGVHRSPGSVGQASDPSRVFKGTRMPGHMGDVRQTTLNLKVVSLDVEKNLLLVRGAVPGPNGSYVIVRTHRKGGEK